MIKKIPYLFVSLAILFLFLSPFFIKVKIDCKSQFGTCPDSEYSKLKTLDGKNLISAKNEVNKTLKLDYSVTNFSTQFKLPNILQVNLVIKKPVFAVLNRDNGKVFLVDIDGTVLSISDKSDLPTIILDNFDISLGKTIPDNYLFALKLLRGVYRMYQVGSGNVIDNSLVVDMPSGIRVIFPMGDADIDVLLGSLRLIYTKITTDNPGKYSEIDLRYKNPILR